MGYYQGTYQISETLNGKPSWEVSAKAIWYSSDINAWAIGKFFIMSMEFDLNKFQIEALIALITKMALNFFVRLPIVLEKVTKVAQFLCFTKLAKTKNVLLN